MANVKSTKKKAPPPKQIASSDEEDESDFYTDTEYASQENDQLNESNPHSTTTSETESINREFSAQDNRNAPATEVVRRETALPVKGGIAPIKPLTERAGSGQIAKDPGSALSLRLDLNLDIEVELKAKIRGDLTLSLL
ncbi:uncharacterized protein N7511_002921 [Penicillium nucicola]|uniref:uncharacterized protein n=1 Tax=Penicillium nucicola TaxID=1850975 RepID=UPI002544D450|nr:uncharacterized protein N7511_002921 [Penicillium nucicola]KAJ5770870.1 hypothetical protein N7511_002921 [Penicillium nucicola]